MLAVIVLRYIKIRSQNIKVQTSGLKKGAIQSEGVGGGGHLQYTWQEVLTELDIANPQKYTSLKFYTPPPPTKTWHQNFLPKNARLEYLNTDLFNQDLKIHMTDLLKYWGCKFSTQKINWIPPLSCILRVPPWASSYPGQWDYLVGQVLFHAHLLI